MIPALALALLSIAGSDEPPANPPVETRSIFVRPMYPGEAIPETRAVRHVLVSHAGALGAPPGVTRPAEEAEELATRIHRAIERGADFVSQVRQHSEADTHASDGVMGSFPRGQLASAIDEWLFEAEIGEVSPPIRTAGGWNVLQRIDAWAGLLQIHVRGRDEAARRRMRAIRDRLEAGEDFRELARELSEDPASAPRGGEVARAERGPEDRLLKAAVFELEVGEVSEPIETPLGLHLVKRVPVEEIDPELTDRVWIRCRGILVAHNLTPGDLPYHERTSAEAGRLAEELLARFEAGEEFAALAIEYDDDPGGRERAGDLGWIHRNTPNMPSFMDRAFTLEVGECLGPEPLNAGWALVLRER